MVRSVLLATTLLVSLHLAALDSRVGLISFQRVAIPNEVPAHLTTAIAQDQQGLLWFGTQRGLVRYDGYEFRVFGNAYVRALLVARDGRIWAGTFGAGLQAFDPATEELKRYRVSYDRVEGLAEDRDGTIWVATTAGLDRLDPRTQRVERLMPGARVRGLLVDSRGRLWVGTRDGLHRRDGNRFESVGLAGQYVTRLYEDGEGRIWIGTEEHGATVLDPRDGSLKRIENLSHYWIYGFAEGPRGEMWLATFGGGVDVVDPRSLRVIDVLRHDATLADTIGADRIGAVFRDRAGVMWVGTWGEGLARHDPRTEAVRAIRMSPSRPDGLTHAAAVRAMEMRDGRIWVGTNGNGIDIFDRDLHRVSGYRADVLLDGAVTCLAEASDGAIWVATLNSMLHRLRPGASRFDHIEVEKLPGGPIRTIAFSADGMLWAGAAEGMVRVDPRTLATRVYRKWPGVAKSSPAIESIVVARNGALWVGSDNGLYLFDPKKEQAARIAGLPSSWVPDLMLARNGDLWIGTSAGAVVMTESGMTRISTQPAEALIEDLDGRVWIGPRLRFDPRDRSLRELGAADGVAFRNFYIASRARTREGLLLFGSPEGLLVVDPRAVEADDTMPPIVATALRVEGKVRTGAPLLRRIELSPFERNFAIDVAALDFASRPVYRYRMEGLESDWSTTSASQRSISFGRLPPGRYVLRVGLANHASRELRLPVTVRPAFHQTGWFRVLVALAALAILYALYRLRVRQLRARERHLERVVAERTRELETAYAQIEEASLTDPLTGLRNRRFLEQSIGADLELATRGHGELVLLLVDLDHFKSVNDTYGHAAGDAVLVQLAVLLRATFRTSDWIVRWGGEEFLIVVRFVDGDHAGELAEKLRAAVESHVFTLPDGATLRRTCSIGVAAWPSSGTTFERAVDIADAALYEAKRSGRNAWRGPETVSMRRT